MKILILTNNLIGKDGWSRYSKDIVFEMQERGYEVLCLVASLSQQPDVEEKKILPHYSECLSSFITTVYSAHRISRIIKQFSPDVIHVMVEPYACILPFLHTNNAKIFLTVHGTYSVMQSLFSHPVKKLWVRIISYIFYRRVHKVIAVSHFTKRYLLSQYPSIKDKTVVVTNGIQNQKVRKTDVSQSKKNILFVGALKKRKGVLESLDALADYKKRFSGNFIFHIVGDYENDSPYFKRIKEKISSLRLENNVSILGCVEDSELEKLYMQAGLFLMLPINFGNEFEGFGLVYLEANSKGVPTIGSNDSGVSEAIIDGETGYIVNQFDPKDVSTKIDLVLNKKMINQDNCIRWAQNNDVTFKVSNITDYYMSVLS